MPRSTSRGKCSLCGKDYGKGQMTTHLKIVPTEGCRSRLREGGRRGGKVEGLPPGG